jgi:hypothetical protein
LHVFFTENLGRAYLQSPALDVLVPAMCAACTMLGGGGRLAGSCLGVLTTFVDSSKDILAHRRTKFLWVAALQLARKDRRSGERGLTELEPGQAVEALLRLCVNTRNDTLVRWVLARRETGHEGYGWLEKEVAVVRNSFLYCLQRHVEDFIGFLNPLLGQLTCLAARLAGGSRFRRPRQVGRVRRGELSPAGAEPTRPWSRP